MTGLHAVVLAGGEGTRLHPYTTVFPKPLMPVGGVPILEILLRHLCRCGVTDVILTTGYLAYLIEGYFGHGSQFDLNIDYLHEDEPLGTAGPLARLAGRLQNDFLVVNGDLLTDLDFSRLMRHHRDTGAAVTVSTYHKTEKINLGVLRITDTGRVLRYDEKPTLDFEVSMGVYAMTPEILHRIPETFYDMPTLISDLLTDHVHVASYRHTRTWLDIGCPDDYHRANDLYGQDVESRLLEAPRERFSQDSPSK
jgi:NDP-sugar pyrophosphorylase family protein